MDDEYTGNVKITSLYKDAYQIRVEDRKTRYFEALWEIPEGITYNSYLLTIGGKNILLDTVKKDYAEEYLEALRSIVDPRSIDYIVVHHAEPDHTGALPRVLQEASNATVIGHSMAKRLVEGFYGLNIKKFMSVKDGYELDLNGEASLKFIFTPWLHWPETIMSYLSPHKILFSGDAFGAFSIPRTVKDDVEERVFHGYTVFMRKYFTSVIGAYRNWVSKAVLKLESINPSVIAPVHGLVLQKHVGLALDLYRKWGSGWVDPGKAVLVYSSMYGFIENAMRVVAERLREKGYTVYSYGMTDRIRPHVPDMIGNMLDAGLVVFAGGTYESGVFPLMRHLLNVFCSKAVSNQKVLVLSIYGWGGLAGKGMKELLMNCKARVSGVLEERGSLTRSRLLEFIDEHA